MTLPRTTMTIAAMAFLLVSCSTDGARPAATTDTPTGCARTTAPADETITFTYTYTAVSQGFDTRRESASSHLSGLNVEASADSTKPQTFTISVLDGPTIATIRDVGPGMTCGIDHDFAEGDYFILSADGNGTQFWSAAP